MCGRTISHIVGHKWVTDRGAIACGYWRGNRGGTPWSNALKCPCDVTARDVGGVRAEMCLSLRRNRGDARSLSATCQEEIFTEIVGIFLCRRDRHKGRSRMLSSLLLEDAINRHVNVGGLISIKRLPCVGATGIRAYVESSWRLFPNAGGVPTRLCRMVGLS